jgi:hypothetical protein
VENISAQVDGGISDPVRKLADRGRGITSAQADIDKIIIHFVHSKSLSEMSVS